ncbi:MAG: hypothetical protein ACSW8B_05825 [bacterium]
MNTIIINKILMHMLDFEHQKIHLSKEFAPLNETTQEYFRKKLEKAFYSPQLKELVVGNLHEMLLRGDQMLESDEKFLAQAKEISEKFFALGKRIAEMPNCNLLYADCYQDGIHKIAIVKLNYRYTNVSLIEDGNVRITRRQVLPAMGQGIDEAIIIDMDHRGLGLIEKKYEIDGRLQTYLNAQWIKGEEKLTDRQKYNTMKKVVSKLDDLYHVNETEALPLLKQELVEKMMNNEPIKPMAIVKEILKKDDQAVEEAEIMLQDLGLHEDDTIQALSLSKTMEKCRLVLDNDVTITLNVEDYVNGEYVKKAQSADGTVQLIIEGFDDYVIR